MIIALESVVERIINEHVIMDLSWPNQYQHK